MAIHTSFEFANEAQFLTQLVIPTLERLGYSLIDRYHGTREFGKDVVFAELDRFGHVRYHALQAKFLPSLGLQDAQELVDDCKQAFQVPFTHPSTGQTERISCFYVVNGGSISGQAREYFFNAVDSHYGGSVALIDGDAVFALDRRAVFHRRELIGERLSGLLVEVRYNRRLFKEMQVRLSEYIANKCETFPSGFRLRLNACSTYVQLPFLNSPAFDDATETYWHDASVVNEGLMNVSIGFHRYDRRKLIMTNLMKWDKSIEKSAQVIESTATPIMESLGYDVARIRSSIEPRK